MPDVFSVFLNKDDDDTGMAERILNAPPPSLPGSAVPVTLLSTISSTYVLSAHVEYSVESYCSKRNAGDTAGDRKTEPFTQMPCRSFPNIVALATPAEPEQSSLLGK